MRVAAHSVSFAGAGGTEEFILPLTHGIAVVVNLLASQAAGYAELRPPPTPSPLRR